MSTLKFMAKVMSISEVQGLSPITSILLETEISLWSPTSSPGCEHSPLASGWDKVNPIRLEVTPRGLHGAVGGSSHQITSVQQTLD